MELFFDTETSDMANFKTSFKSKQPWIVQLGCILSDESMVHCSINVTILPNGRKIAQGALNVHGISEELAEKIGIPEISVCQLFSHLIHKADLIVCHNVKFDILLVAHMLYQNDREDDLQKLLNISSYCTMETGTPLCRLKSRYNIKSFKWPKLQELHKFLFGENFVGAHDAMADVQATRRCYYEMLKRKQ